MFKSVCKTVTIIVKIVGEIKVFFFIFAASVIAFTHTFIHLLWAKESDDTFDDSGERQIHHAASGDYPNNPLMALSATYFFMVMAWTQCILFLDIFAQSNFYSDQNCSLDSRTFFFFLPF